MTLKEKILSLSTINCGSLKMHLCSAVKGNVTNTIVVREVVEGSINKIKHIEGELQVIRPLEGIINKKCM